MKDDGETVELGDSDEEAREVSLVLGTRMWDDSIIIIQRSRLRGLLFPVAATACFACPVVIETRYIRRVQR